MSTPTPPSTPKFIRELRFGPAKQYKTGAVVSTYPKPMFVMSYDEGGLDVVQTTVTYIKTAAQLRDIIKNAASVPLPDILAMDLADTDPKPLSLQFAVSPSSKLMQATVEVTDVLIQNRETIPFKTVVLDPITGLVEAIRRHMGQVNATALQDPRKWASMIGAKVEDACQSLTALNCHVVVLAHSDVSTEEKTGHTEELPAIPGNTKRKIKGSFSQVFYASKINGKPKIKTQDFGIIRGIGARWPANLPAECDPDYDSIYVKTYTQPAK